MASETGTLYVGVTNNLERRIFEHKSGEIDGFSYKYSCHKLVYFEGTNLIDSAILREKQVKRWNRNKKTMLIKRSNPSWRDPSELFG